MRKTREEKAITLIALIITIVVLLILAVVAINSITNDGIISRVEEATNKYNESVQNEADVLQGYLDYLESLNSEKLTVEKVKNQVLSEIKNKEVYDEYGNRIILPAGFKIRVDATTNNADDVTEGIVIEHGKDENQFVWVPVGPINHLDETGKEATTTITLGRYWFSTSDVTDETTGVTIYAGTPGTLSEYNTEDTEATHTKINAIARNIDHFTASATLKGGYYIGRYEAGDSSKNEISERTSTSGAGTLVCKANQVVYNYISQTDASEECKKMYPDAYKADGTGTFSSDLINSYAWDTAIVFIQTFGKDKETITDRAKSVKNYSNLNKSKRYYKTGINGDEYCNINDMSGNALEWSTETNNHSGPCISRGGSYDSDRGWGLGSASSRVVSGTAGNYKSRQTFRPILYVGM